MSRKHRYPTSGPRADLNCKLALACVAQTVALEAKANARTPAEIEAARAQIRAANAEHDSAIEALRAFNAAAHAPVEPVVTAPEPVVTVTDDAATLPDFITRPRRRA